jgi:DNA-binding transcriptional MerR regulator
MAKTKHAFRTISEVAEWLELAPHVLRYWESKFSAVKPVKRAGGRRYYRPADMRVLGGVRKLLHDDGMTIKSVQKMMSEIGANAISEHSRPLPFEQGKTATTLQTAANLPEPVPSDMAQDTRITALQVDDFRIEDTPSGLQASFFSEDPAQAEFQSETKQTATTETPVALDVPVVDETLPPEAEFARMPATAPRNVQTPSEEPTPQITPVHTPEDPTDTELAQGPTTGGLVAKTSPSTLRAITQLIHPLHDRLAALAAKMDAAK